MAGNVIALTIKGVDQFSGVFDKANARLKAINAPLKGLRDSTARFGASLKTFSDTTGLTRVNKSFTDLKRNVGDSFDKLSQIIAPLGVITGAASIAGMYKLVSAWGDFGTKLGFTAQRLGLSVTQLQGLQGAARLAGSSAEAMSSGLQALGQNLHDAVAGRAPEFVNMMNTIGVSFRDSNGHARSLTDVLPQVADKIAKIKDPFIQAQVATALFGGAGEELLPFLRKGAAGIAEYTRQAQKYGLMNDQAAAAALNLHLAQEQLTMSVEGLGNSVAQKLSPILVPLLQQMADWIAKNRDWIATGIGEKVQQFATWLQGIDWNAVGTGLTKVGDGIQKVVGLFGGWNNALVALFGLMAARWAIAFVAPIASLILSLGTVIARLTLLSATTIPAVARAFGIMKTEASEAAAAAEGAEAAKGGKLGAAARVAGNLAMSGVMADGLVNAVDPTDRAGSWIDANIPGASWLDNQASRIGFGRSYAQQAQASGPAKTTKEQDALGAQAIDYFTSQGWTRAQAAGIVGNLQQESGFNTGAQNGNMLGIAQWSGARQAAIAAHFGKPVSEMSYSEQLAAVQWELTQGGEQAAGNALGGTTTAGDAASVVDRQYERPGNYDVEDARRGANASRWDVQIAGSGQPGGDRQSERPVNTDVEDGRGANASQWDVQVAGSGQADPVAVAGADTIASATGTASSSNKTVIELKHANAPPAGFNARVSSSDDNAQLKQPRVATSQLLTPT